MRAAHCLILIIVCWPIHTAFGQGVTVMRNGTVRLSGLSMVDPDKTVEFWKNDQRLRALRCLELHVDAIRRECALDEASTKRLKVIAKGVFAKRTEKGERQLRSFLVRSQVIAPPEDEEVPPAPPETDPDTFMVSGAGDGPPGIVIFDIISRRQSRRIHSG